MATSFLKFCTSDVDRLALAIGVPCVSCAAGFGRVRIGSGKGAASSQGLKFPIYRRYIGYRPIAKRFLLPKIV